MFCVKFRFSSSFVAALKRCGAFFIVLKTFFTLLSDRRPLPPDSAIVGNAELLFRLKDPKRNERDNERDNGRKRCRVEDVWDALGDAESVTFRSNSDVTNLSSSAKSASLFEALLLPALVPAA